ncbi:unnamed protein product, partial [Laminaria digitata]
VVAEEEKGQAEDAAEEGKAAGSEPQPLRVVDGARHEPEANRPGKGVASPAVAATPSSGRGPDAETVASAGARTAGSCATAATDSATSGALGLTAVPCPPVRRKTSRLNPQAAPFTFNPGACSGRAGPASSSPALVGMKAKKSARKNPLAPGATVAPAAPVPTVPVPAVPVPAAPVPAASVVAARSSGLAPTGPPYACSTSPVSPACGGGGNKEDSENSERGDRPPGEAAPVPREGRAAPRPPHSGSPAAARRQPEGGVMSKAGGVAKRHEKKGDGLGSAHMEAGAGGGGACVGVGV